jgi:triphosphatase
MPAERGQGLVIPPETRAAGIELADLTVGDGFQEMLAGALAALRTRSRGTAVQPGAEAVHRFRVGLRRLRSILSAFADVLPDLERRALGDRLRAVAQRYGRAREWDVFLLHCVAPLREALPQHEALHALDQLARAARRHALPPDSALRVAFAAVDEALAKAPWLREPAPGQEERWQAPLGDFARTVLAKRHRQLRKRVKAADLADAEAFHELRIRVKKIRYPSELLKPLFDDERTRSYLRRLVDLQDLMGRMNDARAGTELMRTLGAPSSGQELVAGWLARDAASCREDFPRRVRAFRRAQPFWET